MSERNYNINFDTEYNDEVSSGVNTTRANVLRATSAMETGFNKVAGAIDKIAKVSLAAVAVATAGLAKAMKDLSAESDSIIKIANNTGLAIAKISELSIVTKLAGGDIDSLTDSVSDFTEKFGEAKFDKNSSWAKAFESMGVSLDTNVNGALDETLKKLALMVDEGKKSEAFFAGVDLFGDAYKTTFSDIISGGTGSLNKALGLTKTAALDPRIFRIFNSMNMELRKTKVILTSKIAPYLASLANATSNSFKIFNDKLSKKDPLSIEAANKRILDGLAMFIMKMQEALRHPLETIAVLFKEFTIFSATVLSVIITKLGAIIIALGPLAMLGAALRSYATVIEMGLDSIKLSLPGVSDETKQDIRLKRRLAVTQDLTKTIEDLDKTIAFYEDELKNNPTNAKYLTELAKANKLQEESNAKKLRVANIPITATEFAKLEEEISLLVKQQRQFDPSSRSVMTFDDARAATQKYNQLQKEIETKSDINFMDIMTLNKSAIIDVIVTAIGYAGSARLTAAKNTRGASLAKAGMPRPTKDADLALIEAIRTEGLKDVGLIAAMRTDVVKDVGLRAGIAVTTVMKAYPLLKDLSNLEQWMTNLKDISTNFAGMSDLDIRAMLEGLFTLPKGGSASGSNLGKPAYTYDLIAKPEINIEEIFKDKSAFKTRLKEPMDKLTTSWTNEINQLFAKSDVYDAKLKAQLAKGTITQDNFDDKTLENKQSLYISMLSLDKDYFESKKELEMTSDDILAQHRLNSFEQLKSISMGAFDFFNTLSNAKIARRQKEIDAQREADSHMLDGIEVTDTKRKQIEDANEARAVAQEEELKKKKKRWDIAQVLISTSSAIGQMWMNLIASGSKGGIPGIISATGYAGVMSGVMAAQAGAQIANINSYANGGIIPGTSFNGDNVSANVNSGEMIINRSDQATLFNAIKSDKMGGRGATINHSIVIEGNVTEDKMRDLQEQENNFLERLENGINSLASYGRLSMAY